MFEKPNINIKIDEQSADKSFARLICEPLERGYGTTLGNSLRRIMLSTLEGYAISQIKIDGVLHEFSTIDGVKEDVTEIIMNLKDIAFKNNAQVYQEKIATLTHEGEGIVTAGDIKIDSEVEIVNKDLVIAHLSGNHSKLNMQLVITPGRGYVPAEKNKEQLKGEEYIVIDSVYDPVQRVNMKVENTRVGNQTDYDKLTKYCGKPEYGYNGFSDGLTALLPKDDAATFNWGNGWRTPTKEEWQELFDHTAHRWTAQEGMLGRLFTADNGNSIFLPACGYFKDSDVLFARSGGEYWSSTLDTVEPCFGLFSETGNGSHVYVSSYGRIYGMPVRAVYSSR